MNYERKHLFSLFKKKNSKGRKKFLNFSLKLPVVMTVNFYETLDGDLETLHKSGPRSVISTTQNTDN